MPGVAIGRWIGIDYGTRRIGLALADPGGSIASPAEVLPARGSAGRDAAAVHAWASEQEAGGFVVGLPLNMDGSEGPQALVTKEFAESLARAARLPVELWDERLSSYQADAHLDAGGARKSRRRKMRDALAAQVILQSFLDARNAARQEPDGDPHP